ncbi:SAV_6107 family HEPN domain-containing protein [Corynebacterium sp. P7202]|uniref:SAV_6107 family HEPN domain-containing protein n=1 Tax=Corynebacterium pygosceleis TaxID=2800406 RepID=A0A9Q4GHQ8_9CORY|nr:SAV_6107 family HEPN domain-containing protein [Corynebacterium pygosceleis]MCK7636638.1 SAV_6107 family HEPN domain-containing protein [Corynebacterium pygosceleis]MCX7467391.1 SAV_6107 family HEPN domain-containing protein [Corynebacterium pygosceleis]
MSTVISATTRFSGADGRRGEYLRRAAALLAEARLRQSEGALDAAVEEGYRAALRTAGALVIDSPVSRRRRLPSSAWDQLALLDADAGRWSARLSRYSRLRDRAMYMSWFPDGVVVDEFLDEVEQFIDAAERRRGILPSAA